MSFRSFAVTERDVYCGQHYYCEMHQEMGYFPFRFEGVAVKGKTVARN